MKVIVTKQIGKSTLTFEVEGEKEVDTLAKASFFTTAPDKCGICKSEDIQLDSNKAQGFTFIKIKCLKCNARSQMGQFKDLSGCFWKKFEPYVKGGDTITYPNDTGAKKTAEELEMESYMR